MRRAAALLAVLALAGCGGSEKEGNVDRQLDEAVESIEKAAPTEGLGEATPPSDASAWKTDFTKRLVPLHEFLAGGPPKDGIPAIDRPQLVIAAGVDFLRDREPVIAVTVAGETRGYPIQVLVWHEIVNDEIQGVPVTVTFCPLCNTALAFDRRVRGRVLDFGVSGKLRESDLVMYDRPTESWWQQFGGRALVGAYAGTRLRQLPARIVSWREFRKTFPDSRVLTRKTGHVRPYGDNPYTGYDDVASPPIFPTAHADDDRLQPKERVVFVEAGSQAAAIPFRTLRHKRVVRLQLGGKEVVVRWRAGVASALDAAAIHQGRDVGAAAVTFDGEPVPFSEPFWFAVAALRPDVRIVRG